MAAACGLALLAAYQWSRSRSGRPNPPPKKVRLGPVALDKDRKIPFKLVKREEVSHDTRKFTFQLQSAEHVLGLPVGNHMYLSARVGGELVRRPYTPVTSDDELGFFELVIKVGHTELHTHACGMSTEGIIRTDCTGLFCQCASEVSQWWENVAVSQFP